MRFKLLLLASALVGQAVAGPTAAPTVKLGSTTIVGKSAGATSEKGVPIAAYLGIPFAPQPQRFSPATLYTLPAGTFSATEFGPICLQSFPGPGGPFIKATFTTGAPAESENCLSLNIWAPQNAAAGSLPVMFWIYGGANLFGGSGQPLYDGTQLASKDVVIVTINYRTNVFGFPGASQLPLTQQNLGMLDQRLALTWVRNNIGAFGGDKTKITIFGESAGAVAVESLTLSGPATNPPFRAAIQDSGVASQFVIRPIGPLFAALASAVGCNQNGAEQLTCMRNVPADVLVQTEQAMNLPFGVMVDNATYWADTTARRASKLAARVPTVFGSNQDDGNLFVIGTVNFTKFVIDNYPTAPLNTILNLYPIGPTQKYKTDYDAAAAAFRDATFQCKARIDSAVHTVYNAPAYRYLYQAEFLNQQPIPNAGAYHSAELPLLFGNLRPASTPEQVQLSAIIRAAATTFAKDPSKAPWPKMTGTTTDNIVVVAKDTTLSLKPQDNYDGACIAVWDTYLVKKPLTSYVSEK